MASQVPIFRQIAFISIVPHLLVMIVLATVIHSVARPDDPAHTFLLSAVAYLILSRMLRSALAADHTSGVRLIQQGKFAESIPLFESSYAFFARHPWLDRWRYLALLSSSAMAYREMALCNLGFANLQLGHEDKARTYYARALSEYPNSPPAVAALKMLNSRTSTPAT